MSNRNETIMSLLKVTVWVIFIGFCIQTGVLLFNYLYSLFRPIATHDLNLGLNLSELYNKSKAIYTCLFSLVIALSAMKAYLFYLVIKMFKELDIVKPFSEKISSYISNISRYAISIGFLGFIAHQFTKKLIHKGYEVSMIERYWDSNGAYLLMAAILFIIAQIFKKGIELQHETDLTI